jgi:hypothetical protein
VTLGMGKYIASCATRSRYNPVLICPYLGGENEPWPAKLSQVDDAPLLTAAVETMVARVASTVAA